MPVTGLGEKELTTNREDSRVFSIGAFAIIFDDQKRVLLCHRRDMDIWNLPGGKVEDRELPDEAVIRETKEETGLDVVVDELVGVYGKVDKNELVFSFLCHPVSGEIQVTDEADDCRFFAVNDIPVNISPKQVERIHHALDPRHQVIFQRQTAPTTVELLEKLKEDREK